MFPDRNLKFIMQILRALIVGPYTPGPPGGWVLLERVRIQILVLIRQKAHLLKYSGKAAPSRVKNYVFDY